MGRRKLSRHDLALRGYVQIMLRSMFRAIGSPIESDDGFLAIQFALQELAAVAVLVGISREQFVETCGLFHGDVARLPKKQIAAAAAKLKAKAKAKR